jgi:hypothetical protein
MAGELDCEFLISIKEGANSENVKKDLEGIADGVELSIEGKAPELKGIGSYKDFRRILLAAESDPHVYSVYFLRYIRDDD